MASNPALSKIFTAKIPPMNKEEEARFNQVREVHTTPHDERFPSTNQALHCWNRYNEWLLCLQQTQGGDQEDCKPLRQYSQSICPDSWVEAWDEQREEGSFSGIGTRFGKKHH